MQQRLRIHIKQQDIDSGQGGGAGSCPIAVATKRRLKTDKVSIGCNTAFIKGVRYRMLPAARAFVHRFDMRENVFPCVVVMEII